MRVAVIGGGSWGTALAKLLCEGGHSVTLWLRDPDLAARVAASHENATYLPGIRLPESLRSTALLRETVEGAAMVVCVTPSHAVREVMQGVAPFLARDAVIVSASKGVEESTLKTMSEVLADILPAYRSGVAVLSGPSFAREVAANMPTAVTAAAADPAVAARVQQAFTTPSFRVYTSADVTGVELGGAVKNIIAVAAGVSDGLGFGHNTRGALITRGLAEISRLAVRLGADARTLAGLSGLGDLVLTCTGDLSRNRTVGLRLGRGERLQTILGDMKMVAEGVRNTRSIRDLARSLDVEMPITEQMFHLLYEGKPPRQVVVDLMTRQLKSEIDR
jgi:glycerol-3-phosphate dehydrogenase (NAD(P)+)